MKNCYLHFTTEKAVALKRSMPFFSRKGGLFVKLLIAKLENHYLKLVKTPYLSSYFLF